MVANFKHVIAVIPARYQSTRFPGKALAKIAGKPMIQWVYESTQKSKVSRSIVATDDERILDCVNHFGGEAFLTSKDHQTGTDRINEVIQKINDVNLVVNIQGDEPLISPTTINLLVEDMIASEDADMGTVAVPMPSESPEFQDPNVVKVVVDKYNFAIYFSRSPIPFFRDSETYQLKPLKHWGLYIFRKDFLQKFVAWPQGPLEKAENLEQLRALENGAKIFVTVASGNSVGVDVPDDIRKVEALLAHRNPK